jgi:hypothetical protein
MEFGIGYPPYQQGSLYVLSHSLCHWHQSRTNIPRAQAPLYAVSVVFPTADLDDPCFGYACDLFY